MEDFVKLEHVSKTYGSGEGQVQALKDASFTIGKGELTATMKLRRAVVQQHYAKEIESMYV